MAALTEGMATTHLGATQYRRGGSGTPLVYLHSATGEGESYPFLELLADHFDVIAPMFPGFGASEGVEQIDGVEDVAFHLLDLLDALDLDAPIFVGLSLGGWLSLELATRWPDRVSGLVLINAVGLYLAEAPIGDIFGRTPGEMAEDLFVDQTHPTAAMMHAMDEMTADAAITSTIPFEMVRPTLQTMAATARIGWDPYLHDPKLRSRLWRATAPALVVRAAQDTLVPALHAETYAAELPDAQLVVIDGAAHLAPFERPDEIVAPICRAFGTVA